MKNKVLKSAIIILLLVVITMADFMLVGKEFITYALKNMENSTNHENVEFAAYFKTEEGEKSNINYEMNSDEMKLYIKLAVEKEGCFDGVITLGDSNFKFKKEKNNQYIKSMSENQIILDTIRAERTVELEIGIEPVVEESYNVDMLSKNSILKLTGSYINSEDKKTSIESEKSVALSLVVPSNIETTFAGKVITNRIYKIGEESKRIVQVELNSGVVENVYPIKATEFELELPKNIEEIENISFLVLIIAAGTEKYSSGTSIASIGLPAVTFPSKGISTTKSSFSKYSLGTKSSSALFFASFFLI